MRVHKSDVGKESNEVMADRLCSGHDLGACLCMRVHKQDAWRDSDELLADHLRRHHRLAAGCHVRGCCGI